MEMAASVTKVTIKLWDASCVFSLGSKSLGQWIFVKWINDCGKLYNSISNVENQMRERPLGAKWLWNYALEQFMAEFWKL